MKKYPALDIRASDTDLVYSALDDFSPSAIEERDDALRAFFTTADARDAALNSLSSSFDVSAAEVLDEDWAIRSQQNLEPVTVGRMTIVPAGESEPSKEESHSGRIRLVIQPSMGFGTGHHATTRLCLAALQEIDLRGRTVLDVGTGSGILAIAADRLGAADARGIDVDEDAIHSARENLSLNPPAGNVVFEVADLASAAFVPADVVTANLTGALLLRQAHTLVRATKPGGRLILSGLMAVERDDVIRAFAALGPAVVWEQQEDEWVGVAVKKP